MFILLNHNRIDINNCESVTVQEALEFLELSICRKLRRPLVVAINEKIVTEKSWNFKRIKNLDILEISESVSDCTISTPEHVTISDTSSREEMTVSADMRRSLLSKSNIRF